MSEQSSKFAMTKTVLSAIGSAAATAMIAKTVVRECLPNEFQNAMFAGLRSLLYRFSNEYTIVIDQYDKLVSNELYEAAEIYLGPKARVASRFIKMSKVHQEKSLNMRMEVGDEVVDVFNGVKLKWIWIVNKDESAGSGGVHHGGMIYTARAPLIRCFHLVFHEKYKDMVNDSYLPFILTEAKRNKLEKKTLKLLSVDPDEFYDMAHAWIKVTLDHPATFDTLAMDPEQKEMIMNDLERFIQRKDYYRKIGKAWKRGYLLYGPPGTGKSSLIAAMANYLNFDVYDLELSAVKTNSDLRKLVVWTANKSILVVEDIDCTIELKERTTNPAPHATKKTSGEEEEENKVTLSGFLNFIDGLWSSCGDERIIVFTTNHKEKLDPALLRPGRMDVHVHMSYCTPSGFQVLASNYLGIKDHPLFEQIKEFIRTIQVTPAEVAEQLLKHDEPESTLHALIDFFHRKKKEAEEAAKSQEKEAEAKSGVKEAAAKSEVKEAAAKSEVKEAAAKSEVKEAAAKSEVKEAAAKSEVKEAAAKSEVKEAAAKSEVKEEAAKCEEKAEEAKSGEKEEAASGFYKDEASLIVKMEKLKSPIKYVMQVPVTCT